MKFGTYDMSALEPAVVKTHKQRHADRDRVVLVNNTRNKFDRTNDRHGEWQHKINVRRPCTCIWVVLTALRHGRQFVVR